MDERAASALMAKLAADNGVRLTDVRAEPDYHKRANVDPETFVGRSFCVGRGEIVLGAYEDQELRLASFLHELGHIKNNDGGGCEGDELLLLNEGRGSTPSASRRNWGWGSPAKP